MKLKNLESPISRTFFETPHLNYTKNCHLYVFRKGGLLSNYNIRIHTLESFKMAVYVTCMENIKYVNVDNIKQQVRLTEKCNFIVIILHFRLYSIVQYASAADNATDRWFL